jgi:hypothetical protein
MVGSGRCPVGQLQPSWRRLENRPSSVDLSYSPIDNPELKRILLIMTNMLPHLNKYETDHDPMELCEILRACGSSARRLSARAFETDAPIDRIHDAELAIIRRAQKARR